MAAADVMGKTYKADTHLECLNINLLTLLTEEILTDVALRGGGSKRGIHCHRIVLAASSDYFKAMFTSNMKEQRTNIIPLPTVEHEILQAIINFIYTGEVTIVENTLSKILTASHLFNLSSLVEQCNRFMTDSVCVDNVSQYYEHIAMYQMANPEVESLMIRDFKHGVQGEGILTWSYNTMSKVLSDDHLSTVSEDVIFDCASRWVLHNKASLDDKQIADMLACVRLEHITSPYLANTVEPHRLMQQACQHKRVLIAMKYHMNVRPTDQQVPTVRCGLGGTRLIVICEDWKLLAWTRVTNKWTVITELPQECQLKMSALCSTLGMVAVTGGYPYSRVCMLYEVHNEAWRRMSDMLEAVCGHGALLKDDQLLILGGFNGASVNHVHRLNITTNTWNKLTDLLHPTHFIAASVVSLNDKLYITGGHDSARKLQEYDLNVQNSRWIYRADLPHDFCRAEGGAVSLNQKLHIVMPARCMTYTPVDDKWDVVTYPQIGKYMTQPAIIDNKIVVLAGPTPGEMSLLSFNEEQGTWDMICNAEVKGNNFNCGCCYHMMCT